MREVSPEWSRLLLLLGWRGLSLHADWVSKIHWVVGTLGHGGLSSCFPPPRGKKITSLSILFAFSGPVLWAKIFLRNTSSAYWNQSGPFFTTPWEEASPTAWQKGCWLEKVYCLTLDPPTGRKPVIQLCLRFLWTIVVWLQINRPVSFGAILLGARVSQLRRSLQPRVVSISVVMRK